MLWVHTVLLRPSSWSILFPRTTNGKVSRSLGFACSPADYNDHSAGECRKSLYLSRPSTSMLSRELTHTMTTLSYTSPSLYLNLLLEGELDLNLLLEGEYEEIGCQ